MSSITAGTTSTTTLVHSGDTTGSLVFKTNDTGSGGTTAVTIDTSQNVGIGTSSPTSGKLVISGTSVTTSQGIRLVGDTADARFICESATLGAGILGTFSNHAQLFYTNASERMRIDSSGNVGIGTSSPTSAGSRKTLTVNGASGADFYLQYGGTEVLAIQATSATAPTINYPASGSLAFQNGTERMRIDSSGNLLVGTTSANGTGVTIASPESGGLYITAGITGTRNQIRFANPNGAIGSIQTTNSTTAYNTSSDYRLKENIMPMTGALAKVAQLKPVTYKWKVDGSDGEGFIAHELAEIKPDCVSGEKDAVDADGNPVYQGIDTSFLVATLTAALQETKALLDQQAETINALTARVVALEGQ